MSDTTSPDHANPHTGLQPRQPITPSDMPGHIQWIACHRGPALLEHFALVGIGLDMDTALRVFMRADPDPGLRATQWLVDTYLGGGYLWEDLAGGRESKVAETLGLFAQHRGRLVGTQRNLVSHVSLASLYRAVQPWLAVEAGDVTPAGRALRRRQRERARAESTVLMDLPELRVVVPHTVEASQWWGRGTRWCTAADKSNMFERYNSRAPLVIAVLPTTRYQMWIHDGSVQFMDAVDDEVTAEQVGEHWSALQPLVEWACGVNAGMLDLVPPHLRTAALCAQAVELDGLALAHVPDHLRTDQLCARAMERTPLAMPYLPLHLRTAEVCLAALGCRASTYIMEAVPQHLCTARMWAAAVGQNSRMLGYAPVEMRTLEVCLAALEAGKPGIARVQREDIPPEHRLAVCQAAIAAGLHGLRLVDERQMTPALVEQAVLADSRALTVVPCHLRTPELCRVAVQAHGNALQHLPVAEQTPQLCTLAVRQNAIALAFVRPDLRDAGLCTLALESAVDGRIKANTVTRTWYNIVHMIPHNVLTGDMCELAARQPRVALYPAIDLEDIPPEWRSVEVCRAAVSGRMGDLAHVPPELVDLAMCTLAMEYSPQNRRYLPDHMVHLFPLPDHVIQPPPRRWDVDESLPGLRAHLARWAVGNPVVEGEDTALQAPC